MTAILSEPLWARTILNGAVPATIPAPRAALKVRRVTRLEGVFCMEGSLIFFELLPR